MSFLHLSLAAVGSSLVAIPILLHLLMRQRPKHYVFPALRFVRARKSVNQRRLKLRHVILLMLRCLAIVALAMALARPFVPSAHLANVALLSLLGIGSLAALGLALVTFTTDRQHGLAAGLAALGAVLGAVAAAVGWNIQRGDTATLFADRQAPVAVVLVFDVSPRMEYRQRNQTRLEAAQEFGRWLLRILPPDSEIAVMHTGTTRAAFSADSTAAKAAVDGLQIAYDASPLPDTLRSAIDLVKNSPLTRREVYVVTDLTQQSWLASRSDDLPDKIATEPRVAVQLLDVGLQETTNLSLGDLRLSSNYLAERAPLRIEVELTSHGVEGTHQVELYLEKPDPTRPVIVDGKPLMPERVLRSRETMQFSGSDTQSHAFVLRGLEFGTHHSEVRIAGSDALPGDNQRFFTVEVLNPWPVLIAGPNDVLPDLMSALSAASYNTQFAPIDALGTIDLDEFSVVALLDPTPLEPALWRTLSQFVSHGGGLAIFLGRHAQPVASFNQGEAQRVLPGKLQRQYRAGVQPFYVRLGATPHPVVDTLRLRRDAIPWANFPVFRHWVLSDLDSDADVLLPFSNGHPLLLETTIGAGHVLTMTTPVSDPLNVPGRPEWNRLPTGPDPWPYFVLVNDMFRYLVQSGETTLNYQVGDPGVIRTSSLGSNPRLQVFHPQDAWQDVTASGDRLTYRFTNVPGNFRVRDANHRGRQRGFSVNLSAAATLLDRMDTTQLDEILGKQNYRIARQPDEVHRELGEALRGRDFFPWLLLVCVIVLAAESALANRFYVTRPQGGSS